MLISIITMDSLTLSNHFLISGMRPTDSQNIINALGLKNADNNNKVDDWEMKCKQVIRGKITQFIVIEAIHETITSNKKRSYNNITTTTTASATFIGNPKRKSYFKLPLNEVLCEVSNSTQMKQYCDSVLDSIKDIKTEKEILTKLASADVFTPLFLDLVEYLDKTNAKSWGKLMSLVAELHFTYFDERCEIDDDNDEEEQDDPDNLLEDFEESVAKSLTKALLNQNNIEFPVILTQILEVIGEMTGEYNCSWMDAFANSGDGCAMLVKALKYHMADEKMVSEIVDAIQYVCADEDGFLPNTKQALFKAGACEVLMEAFHRHDGISCAAILGVAANDLDIILRFGELGACEALVEAARNGDSYVSEVMVVLAHDDNIERFKKAGGEKVIPHVEKFHKRLQGKDSYMLTKR
jgi:hypothetical protein